MLTRLSALWASFLIFGCADQGQDRQAENARVKQQTSQEIARICALPEPERQMEIDRAKAESRMVLVCPRSK